MHAFDFYIDLFVALNSSSLYIVVNLFLMLIIEMLLIYLIFASLDTLEDFPSLILMPLVKVNLLFDNLLLGD